MDKIHWKEAKGYRINHLIGLQPDMLTEHGCIIQLTKTVNGESVKGDIVFDKEFVLERVGSIMLESLGLTLIDDIVELVEESISYKREVIESDKKRDFKELIEKYGEDAIKSLIK